MKALACLLVMLMLTGCAELRQAVAAFKQAKEDAETLAMRGADAKLRDSVDWICLHASTRSLAITFTHPDQAEGFKLLCGHPLLLMLPDLLEQMRREREQVETICEPAETEP